MTLFITIIIITTSFREEEERSPKMPRYMASFGQSSYLKLSQISQEESIQEELYLIPSIGHTLN